MPISDSFMRVVASCLAIFKTRFELLSLELEEETARLFSYLLLYLLALFFFCMAILLGVLLVVVTFWDMHRINVIAGLGVFSGILALVIGLSVRNCYRKKPRFLDTSLSELTKDVEALKPASGETATNE